MGNKKLKIVFFYPSYVVGGAEYLIIRIVEYLSYFVKCYIVDYDDGIYRKLNDSLNNDTFIKFEENFTIPEDSYIVTYPSEINRLCNYLSNSNKTNKVLLWGVHPDNFQNLIPLKKYLPNFLLRYYFYPLISKTIQKLNDNNSIVVMDDAILDRYKILYKLDIKIPLCPIPVKVENNNNICRIKDKNNNKFKCVWVGRISVEKVYSLKKVLEDINSLKEIDVEFDIIGTGDCECMIREFKAKPHLKINFLGTITENLDNFLKSYDVCFAMGTSALESAKLGIPTVLVDASYDELPKYYKYRWIFETQNFILGYLLPTDKVNKNKLSMQDVFYVLNNNDLVRDIAKNCYEYVIKYHSLENVSKNLINFISKSTLTIQELRQLQINNTLFHKIYKVLKN
jgi:glycosyltransferase involved in cell wall biosynthesis